MYTGRPRTSVVTFQCAPVLLDHVRALLGDHHRRRVDVCGRYLGHDGRVDHAQLAHAVDAEPRVHHGGRVVDRCHLARAAHVVHGEADDARATLPVLVRVEQMVHAAGHPVAHQPGAERAHGVRAEHALEQADAGHDHVQVGRVGEVAGVDERLLERAHVGQAHGAAAPGTHDHREHGEPFGVPRRAPEYLGVHVRVETVQGPGQLGGRELAGQQQQLQVGEAVGRALAPDVRERQRLGAARHGERARVPLQVVVHVPRVGQYALQLQRAVAVDHRTQAAQRHVVHQVLTHRQVADHRQAHRGQVFARPNARQHQQLRRVDRAPAHDHLFLHEHPVPLPQAHELHALRLLRLVVDQYPRHRAQRLHVQVLPVNGRLYERLVRAATSAVPHGRLCNKSSRKTHERQSLYIYVRLVH